MAELTEEVAVERINTGVEGAEDKDTVNITHRAVEMINKVKEENNLTEEFALRLGTRSGGCSGMSYAIGFDSDKHPEDRFFEAEGLKLVIDSKSLFYFMGVTLDYTDGPEGSGFVFHNPNNFHTCGCSG